MSTAEARIDPGPRRALLERFEEALPEQVILVYGGPDAAPIEIRLGASEYSYHFVMAEYLPALEELGAVVHVTDPAREVDDLHAACAERGVPCVLLSFTPPHRTPLGLECPTIPVFAWEFEDIPDEIADGGAESDWTRPLGRLGWAITHSRFSVDAVRRAMRADFPVECIPAPLWDRFDGFRADTARGGPGRSEAMSIPGPVLDSRTLAVDSFAPGAPGAAPSDPGIPPPLGSAVVDAGEVVYTCVYNPYDDRKNWFDIVGTFCTTMRDTVDATLILKLVHSDPREGIRTVLHELHKCAPFRCRVLLQFGYLAPDAYERLIRVTDFALNASRGEGQCLPLMEFMSAGRPAIAPTHTALADYVDASNAFLVESSVEPSVWPHDPRQVYRTLRHRINPESLARAIEESYRVAKLRPDRYGEMSNAAVAKLGTYCSLEVATARLRRLLTLRRGQASTYGGAVARTARLARLADRAARVGRDARHGGADRVMAGGGSTAAAPGPGEVSGTAPEDGARAASVDPRLQGLEDAYRSGWFQDASGELLTGFRVGPDDRVLDVGCGEGAAASFCARMGARVVFLDILPDKVEGAMRLFPELAGDRHLPLVCDATDLALPDASVTRVVSIDVLEHLDDPALALREMVRVGEPGARYLLSVPDPIGERVQKSLAPAAHFRSPNHLHIFGREEFRSLVRAAGLSIEAHRFTGFYWALAMCLYWTEGAKDGRFDGTATLDRIRPPYPDAVVRWAETWAALQALPRGDEARAVLNDLMPKNQVILARKPTP